MVVELHPHQQIAVDKMHNGSILCGGVGVGKSITAAAYYYSKVLGGVYNDPDSILTPCDVLVVTTAKKRDSLDWDGEFARFGISRIRENSPNGIQLTVDSWNNIAKYEDLVDTFVIFDEQRVVGTGAWTKSFFKIAEKNKWVLLSATPGDTWLDYIPVFVANGFYKNRTAFKREHVVYNNFSKFPKVDRYVSVNKLVRFRNQILVEMPYLRHTTRVIEDVQCGYDKQLLDMVVKKRWHVYENRPLIDVGELLRVMRKVVNTDPSRLEHVQRLVISHPKLIVFYNFDYELELLRTVTSPKPSTTEQAWSPISKVGALGAEVGEDLSTCGRVQTFAMAEWNGHKHEEIPKTDSWIYLVQYTAGAEGWNCVETDAMVFYSQTYSYKGYEQSQGRIDRLNTPYSILRYYNLMSASPIDLHIRKALKSKKNFNERALKAKFGF